MLSPEQELSLESLPSGRLMRIGMQLGVLLRILRPDLRLSPLVRIGRNAKDG